MSVRTQVKLRLTEKPEVLSALRRVNALRQLGEDEYMSVQFDGQEFRFFHGKEIVVPAPVAEGLYRGSGVLLGDAMNGSQVPGVEIVEKWELGEQEPSRKVSKTACTVCGEEQGSIKGLIAHLATHEVPEEQDGGTQEG